MKFLNDYDGICTVVFNHPDYSSIWHQVAYKYEEDEIAKYEERDDILYLCRYLWKRFNSSGFYHEMELHHEWIIDNEVHRKAFRFNGWTYEVM